jgi:uncharacterized phage protein (TIGR01671 family)
MNKHNIGFRAWNKKAKKMFLVNDLNGLIQNTIVCCKHGDACDEMEGIDGWLDEVELMQYTGLKDKNGKEIYEGDILQNPIEVESGAKSFLRFEVFFSEGSLSFRIRDLHTRAKYSNRVVPLSTLEVIGNIYENPELLSSASSSPMNKRD